MTTAEALKTLRRQQALTQQELADRAGVNRVTIARIETGVDQPVPRTIRKLAAALQVEVADLGTAVPPQVEPVDVDMALLDSVLSRFAVRPDDDADVRRLVGASPGLGPLLAEAATEVSRHFPDAVMRLEHLADPEDGDEQVFLCIAPPSSGGDAKERLRRFDESWWYRNVGRAGGRLLIDTRPA